MAQTTTLILFPQTTHSGSDPQTITGEYVPAAAYYLGNQDSQTICYSVSSMSGTIEIQATLASNPTDDDWFFVNDFDFDNDTTTGFSNINGNFVYIRAKITNFTGGIVQFVKLAY